MDDVAGDFQGYFLGVGGVGAHLDVLGELAWASLREVGHLDFAGFARTDGFGRTLGPGAAARGVGRDDYQRGIAGVGELEFVGDWAAILADGAEIVLFDSERYGGSAFGVFFGGGDGRHHRDEAQQECQKSFFHFG